MFERRVEECDPRSSVFEPCGDECDPRSSMFEPCGGKTRPHSKHIWNSLGFFEKFKICAIFAKAEDVSSRCPQIDETIES